jgi:hypothetical protein
MSSKLEFNEADLLNATWSGMKAIKAKPKKDATDLNALSKGTSAITKFLDVKLRWQAYADRSSPKKLAARRPAIFLE